MTQPQTRITSSSTMWVPLPCMAFAMATDLLDTWCLCALCRRFRTTSPRVSTLGRIGRRRSRKPLVKHRMIWRSSVPWSSTHRCVCCCESGGDGIQTKHICRDENLVILVYLHCSMVNLVLVRQAPHHQYRSFRSSRLMPGAGGANCTLVFPSGKKWDVLYRKHVVHDNLVNTW